VLNYLIELQVIKKSLKQNNSKINLQSEKYLFSQFDKMFIYNENNENILKTFVKRNSFIVINLQNMRRETVFNYAK